MNLDYSEEQLDGRTTSDRFNLICKVVEKEFSYREHQSRNKEWNEIARAILLLPEQTTEADIFYSVWLPLKYTPEELKKYSDLVTHHEFVMEAGAPVNGYFRGALACANNLIERPHIFVMTKRAEDLLRPYIGKKIRLTTLGDHEEEKKYHEVAETRDPYA